MTCRCYMCGNKATDRIGRKSYVRAGVRTSEDGEMVRGTGRKVGRKLRRVREDHTWRNEIRLAY